MASNSKNKLVYAILIIMGAISGTIIGEILGSKFSFLSFLKTYFSIGVTKQVYLDLYFVNFTFGISFNINLMTIIGILLVIILFRK